MLKSEKIQENRKLSIKMARGITLIALVVTIIVLLILAGISISMLAGNNSILTRAGEAKEKTENTGIIENINIAYNSGKIEKYTGTKTLAEKMEEELIAIYGEDNVEVEDYGNDSYIVTVNDEKYNIEDGKIEKDGPVVNPYNPDGWAKAWVYPTSEGNWSTEITEKSLLPESYEIIAKLYEINEANAKYSLVIEGEGEMPPVGDEEEGYAWQSGVELGNGIFQNQNNTVKIVICDGITSIGDFAFASFTGLVNVKISNSVTSIGQWAFYNCINLTNIRIPNSVTSIGQWAFYNCINLTNIRIPNGVTAIGEKTFSMCGLTNIKIPNSVTSIGEFAFSDCYNLTDIEIPDSVINIDLDVFLGCENLTKVKGGQVAINLFNDVFNSIKITEFIIVDGITEIEDNSFIYYSYLKKIKIPDSVISIGNNVFNSNFLDFLDIDLSRNIENIEINKWIASDYCSEVTEQENYNVKVKWRDNYFYYIVGLSDT